MEEFHEQLESTARESPGKDFLILQADWNVKVDLMPMNSGQEQWDALEWDKLMKTEKEKELWNSHTGTRKP